MANYQLYITRVGTGIWNGDPSANPETNTGGIDLSSMEGTFMSATLQGSGDSVIRANFGQSAFKGTVPQGYSRGWLDDGCAPAILDQSRAYGSAVGHVTDNLEVNFLTTQGMIQSTVFRKTKQLYFEIEYISEDVFNVFAGGGIARDNWSNSADPGGFNFWFTGTYGTSNPLGGGLAKSAGWPTFQVDLFALGPMIANDIGVWGPTPGFEALGFAVFLTPGEVFCPKGSLIQII